MSKTIINGKKYDTETANDIERYEWGNPSDWKWECEILYRKRTGEFFLYGKGGPLSKYGKRMPDRTLCSGSKITPLSEEEAREWGEKHMSVDDYEEIFGEVEE